MKKKKRTVHSSISNELFLSPSLSLSACTNLLNSFIKAIDLIWTFTHYHHRQQATSTTKYSLAISSKITTQFTNLSSRQMIAFYISHCVCVCIQSFPHWHGSTFNFCLGGSNPQFDLISNCDERWALHSGERYFQIIAINFNLHPLKSHWLSIFCTQHNHSFYVDFCFELHCKCKCKIRCARHTFWVYNRTSDSINRNHLCLHS